MHRLLEVGSDLAAARTIEDISKLAVEQGLAAVEAVSATVWLRDDDQLVVGAHSARVPGRLEGYRSIPLSLDAPVPMIARTGEAVYLGSSAEYAERYPTSYARVAPTMPAEYALAMLPIVGTVGTLGVICFTYEHAKTFEAPDKAFKEILARQVALAIERVRLQELERAQREAAERAAAAEKELRLELARAYREEREAHLEAEEATRAREEILSVVSHDLRNPLSTVMMAAATLLTLDLNEKGHRVRPIAERVHRQAERMARLIEDLVDFAGIQAGRLALARAKHEPETILAEARELFGPIAEERGLVFESTASAGLPSIECDCERVVQLISNLVSNALKVTPKGGTIAIGAEPKDREIVFFVRDTGPGIDPEELPNLFERFWRSKKASYKGAGLGLSIARGIVDAHGGRIWAESQVGVGSTFYFSLSSLQN
jgi:signal transduction histidine kinase